MRNIEMLLKEIGIEIPIEAQKVFMENFNKEYKTIADYTKQTDKISNLNAEINSKNGLIEELNTQIKSLNDDSGKLKDLESKIQAFESSEKERLENEERIKIENSLRERFDNITKDKQFKHEFVKSGAYEIFKKALQDESNKSKGDAQIYADLEKDNDWYTNPQEPVKIQSVGNNSTNSKETFPSFF